MRAGKVSRRRGRPLATAVAALFVALLASMTPASASVPAPISGAGSTWSYNALHDWITNVAQFGLTVNYAPVGSTAGRTDFRNGTVDFAASDIPYGVPDGSNSDPQPTRGYAYLPLTAGGLAFVYHLSIGGQRATSLRLSGAVLAGIFTNTITQWNDPAIALDNPGLTLPAEPIVPVVQSDSSGESAQFTQWMIATQGADWTAYCATVGFTPCIQTSTYPVKPASAMIGEPGDLGVGSFVAQPQAEGTIGYVQYSTALETALPIAKVLNAAGYYTTPTSGNVAVSLLRAQLNTDPGSPLNGTADLSHVYADTDPRAYELSSYSFLIVPTDTSDGFTTDKGDALGMFGQYALCQGQQQVDQLGYSALPTSVVQEGYAQLAKIPGASVPTPTTTLLQSCNNPAFASDGTNALANDDPYPPACDQQGPTQCGASGGGTTVPVGSVGLIGSAALAGCALFVTQCWGSPRKRRDHQSAQART